MRACDVLEPPVCMVHGYTVPHALPSVGSHCTVVAPRALEQEQSSSVCTKTAGHQL